MTGVLLWLSLWLWMRLCRSCWRYTHPKCFLWLISCFTMEKRWFACIDLSLIVSVLTKESISIMYFAFSPSCCCLSVAQLILRFPLKSLVDVDPWHHLVEASFQRQSRGKAPHWVIFCWRLTGWEAFGYIFLVFIVLLSLNSVSSPSPRSFLWSVSYIYIVILSSVDLKNQTASTLKCQTNIF